MLFYQCDDHGCVYSVDSEGTLYYAPQNADGTVNLDSWEDWTEVDHMALLGEEEEIRNLIDDIHDKLIHASKVMGEYFQNPSFV